MYQVQVFRKGSQKWALSSNDGLLGKKFNSIVSAEQAWQKYGNSTLTYRAVSLAETEKVEEPIQPEKVKPVLKFSDVPEVAFTLEQENDIVRVMATDREGTKIRVLDIESRFGDEGRLSISRWVDESGKNYFVEDKEGRVFDYYGKVPRKGETNG